MTILKIIKTKKLAFRVASAFRRKGIDCRVVKESNRYLIVAVN